MKDDDFHAIWQADCLLKNLPSHAASLTIISGNGEVNNGSAGLVCINGRKFVITNKHVIDLCVKTVSSDSRAVIALGEEKFQFNPGLIIDTSVNLDLATFELPSEIVRSLEDTGHRF